MAKRKKRGALEWETIIKIALGLFFLVLAAGLIMLVVNFFGGKELGMWACWMSNGLKSSNFIFKSQLPTTCSLITPDEQMDRQGLVKIMKDTWWMYGKGDWDIGMTASEQTAFYFTAKEDIDFKGLMNYLLATKDGQNVADIKDSDYNYLQKGSYLQTVCYGKSLSLGGYKLKAGEKYFIMFFDSARLIDTTFAGLNDLGDKIAITAKPRLEDEEAYLCPSITNANTGVGISYTLDGLFKVIRMEEIQA